MNTRAIRSNGSRVRYSQRNETTLKQVDLRKRLRVHVEATVVFANLFREVEETSQNTWIHGMPRGQQRGEVALPNDVLLSPFCLSADYFSVIPVV